MRWLALMCLCSAVLLAAGCNLGTREIARNDLYLCPLQPPGSPLSQFDTRTLEELPLRKAKQTARLHGCTVRVVERNGEPLEVFSDLAPGRINVDVEDGIIERVTEIG